MLETIAIILVLLWLLGLVSSYTLGGFIHILLVVALILIVVRVMNGNKPIA
ncbi:MAG: lmo0937 family membrane protein [Lacunisphaera sp.]